jgi:hypothetical protein
MLIRFRIILKSVLATGEYLFIKTSRLVIIMDGCCKLLSVHVLENGLLKHYFGRSVEHYWKGDESIH